MKKISTIFYHIVNWVKNVSLSRPKLLMEIFISIGFVTYLTYQQTKISKQQLAISQQQQKMVDFDHRISVYEHSARFNFTTIVEQDSIGNCLTEDLVVENRGYPIKDCNIETFSFIEVQIDSVIGTELRKIKTIIFPIELYFATGTITEDEKGILAAYTNSGNCRRYFEVQHEFQKHIETYYWTMKKFHLIEVSYLDFLNNRDTVYLCDYQSRADLTIPQGEANRLLRIYKEFYKLSIYNLRYDLLKRIILYKYDGQKIYPLLF